MTTEQIKEQIAIGDFITLSKMLGIKPEAARMRWRRRKADAVEAMAKIVEQRQKLIGQRD